MTDMTELLGSLSKDRFSQTVNKLLNECFLLKKAPETKEDYRCVQNNREVFETVLDLLGYDLVVRDEQGVITVVNRAGTGRVRFSKLESVLLLILRLLYIEKMKELSQVENVIALLEDIQDKYAMLRIGNGRIRKDLLLNALRSFKKVNLIKNLDRMDTADPGIRIQIYPSILFAVPSVNLDELYKVALGRLDEYAKGGEADGDDDDSDEAAD